MVCVVRVETMCVALLLPLSQKEGCACARVVLLATGPAEIAPTLVVVATAAVVFDVFAAEQEAASERETLLLDSCCVAAVVAEVGVISRETILQVDSVPVLLSSAVAHPAHV